MGLRLHRGGRTRAWLGKRMGGDEALGDRLWRRVLHVGGLVILLVYVVPSGTFGPVPVRAVPVILLAVLLVVEGFRWRGQVELPTIRPHERARMASYAYYGIALVLATLAFPEAVAVTVIVGSALIDPLLGELRLRPLGGAAVAIVGGIAYVALAVVCLHALTDLPLTTELGLGLLGAMLAVLVEGPGSVLPLDDDFAMVIVPGIVLALVVLFGPWAIRH